MVHMSLLEEFKNLIYMCALPKGQRDILAPSMIQSLMTNIYVYMADVPSALSSAGVKGKSVSAQEIRNYIDSHYVEKLKLDDLAGVFFCSKGYLNTVFRQENGMSIMQYVIRRRLQYAQVLIENGYPAGQACTLSGFPEYSYFYRA